MRPLPEAGALPAADVVELLRRGEIRSAELTEAYLERIAAYDGELRAFVTVTADVAREQARAADEALGRGEPAGALHGLPVAVKDNIDTAGIVTTMGSRFFVDNVPERDAEVIRRLRSAGAVLVGKAQLHEFAFGATTQNPHYGACRNPWDRTRVPGGSSGGSGAAVAADFCAVALGTDTGGSVRIPAAVNGLSGLRPTVGAVSLRGVFPITWSLDTVGPLARSVADVARTFAVLAGYDREDPLSVEHPVPDVLGALDLPAEGVRVGVPRAFYFDDVDDEVVRSVETAAEALAGLGAEVEDVDLRGAEEAFDAANLIVRAEAYAIHRERLEREPHVFGADVRRRIALGEAVTGYEYAAYRQTGRLWRRALEETFRRVDVLLTPTTGTVAPVAGDADLVEVTRRLARLTQGWSFAGLPSLTVPCGLSAEGLPIGLQLAGPRWGEDVLFRLGAAYQRATTWHLQRPDLAAPGTAPPQAIGS